MGDRANEGHDTGPVHGWEHAFFPPFSPPFYAPPFQMHGFFSSPLFQAPGYYPPPPFFPSGPGRSAGDPDRPYLEAQRAFFSWYRDQLTQCADGGGADDRLREAMNMILAWWLDAIRALREQREHAVRVQTELVSRYLDILDQLLDRPDQGPR